MSPNGCFSDWGIDQEKTVQQFQADMQAAVLLEQNESLGQMVVEEPMESGDVI